jgi:hypothetical protein
VRVTLNTVPFFLTSTEPPAPSSPAGGVDAACRYVIEKTTLGSCWPGKASWTICSNVTVRAFTVRGRELTMISNVSRAVMNRSMPGSTQIDQLAMLDQAIFAAGNLEEDGLPLAGLGQAVEHRAADDRLAPAQLVVVQRQLEVAIRQEGDEPLGAALTQVERLVQPHLLEVARRAGSRRGCSPPAGPVAPASSNWRPSGTGSLTTR